MSDQDIRLALAEEKLEQHDKLHAETQRSIQVLSDGISKLVQAEIRREQDEGTFKRLFTEIKNLNEEIKNNKERQEEKDLESTAEINKIRSELQAYKDAQATKELNAYKGVVLKVIGLAALILASVIAGYLGAHLI